MSYSSHIISLRALEFGTITRLREEAGLQGLTGSLKPAAVSQEASKFRDLCVRIGEFMVAFEEVDCTVARGLFIARAVLVIL